MISRKASSPSAPPSSARRGSKSRTDREKPNDIAARDIGGIGDDQVERPLDPGGPMADANLCPPGEAAGLEIGASDLGRRLRPVDAEPMRARELAEQRAQKRARAHPEIEDAERLAPPGGEQSDRRLDDRLRFWTRIEHVRRQREREAPEFAPADDPRQRLAARPPNGEFVRGAWRRAPSGASGAAMTAADETPHAAHKVRRASRAGSSTSEPRKASTSRRSASARVVEAEKPLLPLKRPGRGSA